jgi:sulfur carrier protein ThiS
MKITLEYLGFLKIESIQSGSVVDVPDGSTAASILDMCKLNGSYRKYIVPIINGERTSHDRVLKEGDRMFIYLPVGGG